MINIIVGMTPDNFISALNSNFSESTRHTFDLLTVNSTIAEINDNLNLISAENITSGKSGLSFITLFNNEFASHPPKEISKENGLLTITFDDSYKNIYLIAIPILEAQGIKATFYLTMDWVLTLTGYLSTDDIIEMYYKGMDIQDHGYAHPNYTGITDEAIISDLEYSDTAFTNMNLPIPKHLALPFGARNAGVDAIVTLYRETARLANGTFDPADVTDVGFVKLAINAGRIDGIGDLTALKAKMDQAKTEKKSIVLYAHGVTVDGAEGSISSAKLNEIIDYAQTLEMQIVTMEELYELMI